MGEGSPPQQRAHVIHRRGHGRTAGAIEARAQPDSVHDIGVRSIPRTFHEGHQRDAPQGEESTSHAIVSPRFFLIVSDRADPPARMGRRSPAAHRSRRPMDREPRRLHRGVLRWTTRVHGPRSRPTRGRGRAPNASPTGPCVEARAPIHRTHRPESQAFREMCPDVNHEWRGAPGRAAFHDELSGDRSSSPFMVHVGTYLARPL